MERDDKVTIQSGWPPEEGDAETSQELICEELSTRLAAGEGGQKRHLYALLDAAHGDLALKQLATVCQEVGDLEYEVLGPGRTDDELFSRSAFLVPCPSDSDLPGWLCTEGLGKGYGVLLTSEASAGELAAHLHPLTVVRDERDRTLLFRFYDPRVLRVYLPTCTPWELRRFFGPVESFLAEAPEGEGLLEFDRPAFDGEEEEEEAEDPLAGQTIIAEDRPDLVIREAQLEVFRGEAGAGFRRRVGRHLKEHFPDDCADLGEEGLREAVQHGVERAAANGLRVERDVCLYLGLMFLFGPSFDEDLSWAGQILGDERLDTAEERINALWVAGEEQLQDIASGADSGGTA